jgi:hypothetical protein
MTRAAPPRWRPLAALVLAALLLPAGGCGLYSFTGATIPAHIQTIAIPPVDDRSVGAPAGLDQRLTELLIDRFAGRTRLSLVSDEEAADAVLFAEIDRYGNEPAAVTGGEVAALNRVTVSVRVRYMDRVQDRERLARSFSQRETYDAASIDLELTTAEEVLIRLADDIFTAATSDW